MIAIKILFAVTLLITLSTCHKNCHFKKTPKDQSILQRRLENPPDRNLQNIVPKRLRIKYDVTGLNTIIDPKMKVYLEKTILVATNYFSDLITLKQPLTQPIQIQNSSCHQLYSFSHYQMSQQYDDVDLMIFVSYVVDSNEDYVAYTAGCQQDRTTGRNIVGMINFNAYYIEPDNNYEFQNQLQTTIHELFHVIVFDSSLYEFFISPSGQKYNKLMYSNDDLMLKLPNIAKWVQNYYNCPTAQGMQLENVGHDGSDGVHWKMSVLYDDTMTSAGDDTLWSGVNNALLLDSGWYEVNLKAQDYLTWGKGKGCEFLDNKCLSANQFKEFCYEEEELSPTFSFNGKGVCLQSQWEKECNIVISEDKTDICYNPLNLDPNSVLKESYGEDSRAFISTIQPNQSVNSSTLRCYKNICVQKNGAYQIEIYVGSETIICSQSYVKVKSSSTDLKGKITCPNIQSFCEKQNECTSFCSSNGYCISGKCICLKGFTGQGCQCKKGTVYNNGNCDNCAANCAVCSESDTNQCFKCNTGFFLSGAKCHPCLFPCKTCIDTENKCLSCLNNFSFNSNKCILFSSDIDCQIPLNASQCQQCSNGKGIDFNGKCTLTCDASCQTCFRSSTNCVSCPQDQILFKNKCICEDGYFMNEQYICEKCSIFCKVCTSAHSCDVCIDLYSINPTTHQCRTCPQGSFVQGQSCQQCNNNCLECENNANNCIQCRENTIISGSVGQQVCNCNYGYFYTEHDGYCNQCGPNGEMNQEKCICNRGYFMDLSQDACIQCLNGCIMCSDFESCQLCQNGVALVNLEGKKYCL